MALEQEGAEGVETEVENAAESQATEQQAAEAEKTNEDGDPPAPPTVEDIASRLGWVPKDKFTGDESRWKPADQFIIDGRKIQERTSGELKELRGTLETIKATNASLLQDRLREQKEELETRFRTAVEKGDPEEAAKLRDDIGKIDQQRETLTAPRSSPAPETEEWVKKNAWFDPNSEHFDPVAHKRAADVCMEYAKAKLPAAEQLKRTEAIIRREYPHLFPADDKAPPQVNGQTTRSTAAPAKKGGTYADLPKAAKEVADDLVDRGLISDKEQYARNYFAQAAKGQ